MNTASAVEGDRQDHQLPIDYSPDKMEWEQLKGLSQSGQSILHRLDNTGGDIVQIDNIDFNRSARHIEFEIDGLPCRVQLHRKETGRTTALSGLKKLLEEVNRGCRLSGLPWCFICTRQRSANGTSDYVIRFVERTRLRTLVDQLDVVAGLNPASFELSHW
jgi:hypothetical protein